MDDKRRVAGIALIVILGLTALIYLSGLLGQLLNNYANWLESGGISGDSPMSMVNWGMAQCFRQSFTACGMFAVLIFLAIVAAFFAFITLLAKSGGLVYVP